jgi:hypothetical protein
MAVGILLSSLRLAGRTVRRIGGPRGVLTCVTLVGLLLAGTAEAQAPKPRAPAGAAANADCAKLPGGNAPVQRMARLQGGMSVRNLELTYFGKPLYTLTDSDIAYLGELWPQCGTYDATVAEQISSKLRTLISDAKAARQDSLDWIASIEKDLAKLKPGEDSIRQIHDLWQQMLNREFEMLQSDLQYLAKKLSDKREELYTGQQQRQRTLVNPFDPGAPETRSIKE